MNIIDSRPIFKIFASSNKFSDLFFQLTFKAAKSSHLSGKSFLMENSSLTSSSSFFDAIQIKNPCFCKAFMWFCSFLCSSVNTMPSIPSSPRMPSYKVLSKSKTKAFNAGFNIEGINCKPSF